MILKESDLRRLINEVLSGDDDLLRVLKKSYLEFSEKNPGVKRVDFQRHVDSLMQKAIHSDEVIVYDEEDDYTYWTYELKNFFRGRLRKWVKVSLREIKPTLDEFERMKYDTSEYKKRIRRAGFAWIRFSRPRIKDGKRCAAFEVRIGGFKYDNPKLLHYIDIEELGDKIRFLNGTPSSLRLEE